MATTISPRACLRELVSTATVLLLVDYTLGAAGIAGRSHRGYVLAAVVSFLAVVLLLRTGVLSLRRCGVARGVVGQIFAGVFFAFVGAAEFFALNRVNLYPVVLVLIVLTLALNILAFHAQARKIIEGRTAAYKPLFGSYASIFLNLVLGFAFLYVLLESWRGQSLFRVGEPTDKLLDYLYFSVVTMTNLGYGDIVPQTGLAKGLVMIQSVLGFLLLSLMAGIVVARLGRRSR
ncbi:MAG: two pore domain potassium channel family protein [Calditrichaeota bacterium]|nr:two pore domain potassium channel family protein [Calditrichota bacterium]